MGYCSQMAVATAGRLGEELKHLNRQVTRRGMSLAPVLPLMFQLRGKPYSLKWSHFMFEPMFRVVGMPRRMMLLCGRQVSKSTSMAASQIGRAAVMPNYNILTVMPLYEQVRKFSNNYVRPFIITSGMRHRLVSDLGTDSVLQRAIGPTSHNSNLFYSYSSGDPSRVRGVAADEVDNDEIQDLDHADLPVIEQCMGASPYKVVRYTGTPKTFDNTAHILWEDSSQARWHIPCHCGKINRAAVDGDLLQMIGDNSERPDGTKRTLICARCGDALNSRIGWYEHDFPERQLIFPGYHAPQPILPMHYESPKDWSVLLETRDTKPAYAFHNEVLGESYDAGSKIITQEELVRACQTTPCEPKDIEPNQYTAMTTGIDWGGRGKEKTSDTDDFISNTAMAVGGMRPDGVIEIPWLHKVPYVVDISHESKMACNVAAQSRSDFIALDYGGQGNVQQAQVVGWGWPEERIIPFTYSVMAPTRPIVWYNPPASRGARSSYTLDKPRSILLLAELLKRGLVLLPNSERYIKDHLRDFLNIYEESLDNPSGSPRRLVKRISRRTDDIVHAVNFVVISLYHYTQSWPALAKAFVDEEVLVPRG